MYIEVNLLLILLLLFLILTAGVTVQHLCQPFVLVDTLDVRLLYKLHFT